MLGSINIKVFLKMFGFNSNYIGVFLIKVGKLLNYYVVTFWEIRVW